MFTSPRRIVTVIVLALGFLSAAVSVYQAHAHVHSACVAQHKLFNGFRSAVGMTSTGDRC